MITLLKLVSDTKEMIDECHNDTSLMQNLKFFVDLNEQEILKDAEILPIFANCIGIYRKIASFKDYREKIAQKIINSSMNFLHKNV